MAVHVYQGEPKILHLADILTRTDSYPRRTLVKLDEYVRVGWIKKGAIVQYNSDVAMASSGFNASILFSPLSL
jgi:ribosomal protein S8E